jgi:hypothetical protein
MHPVAVGGRGFDLRSAGNARGHVEAARRGMTDAAPVCPSSAVKLEEETIGWLVIDCASPVATSHDGCSRSASPRS